MAANGLADAIRRSIEADIEQGRLLPGRLIDERSLAAEFSVSRTPVRQALQQLHGRGLVQVIPRIGAMVPKLSVRDLLLIYEVLAELEAAAGRLAARRITRNEATKLQLALEGCASVAEKGEPREYVDANKAFHEVIYETSRNPLLADEIRKLRAKEQAYRLTRFDRPGGMFKSAQEHAKIAAAILKGDADHAHEAVRKHILVGATEFLDYVAGLPDDDRLFEEAKPKAVKRVSSKNRRRDEAG